MPIGVVILVKTKQFFSDAELNALRIRFMFEMNLTQEDFYNGGALIKVSNKDYEIIPENEKEFLWLSVNFHRAFYDIEYQRGDIKLYLCCAEWLENEIPDCEIHYGHDGDDESIVLFDEQKRKSLLQF